MAGRAFSQEQMHQGSTPARPQNIQDAKAMPAGRLRCLGAHERHLLLQGSLPLAVRRACALQAHAYYFWARWAPHAPWARLLWLHLACAALAHPALPCCWFPHRAQASVEAHPMPCIWTAPDLMHIQIPQTQGLSRWAPHDGWVCRHWQHGVCTAWIVWYELSHNKDNKQRSMAK